MIEGSTAASLLGFSAGAREQADAIPKPTPAKVQEASDAGASANKPSDDPQNTLDGFILPPPASDPEQQQKQLPTHLTLSSPTSAESSNLTSVSSSAVNLTQGLDGAVQRATPSSSLPQTSQYGATDANAIATVDSEESLYFPTVGPSVAPLPLSRLVTQDLNKITDRSPLLDPSHQNRYNPRPAQHARTDPGFASAVKKNINIRNIVGKIPTPDVLKSSPASAKPQSNNDFDAMYTSGEQDFMDWLESEFLKIQTFYKKKETEGVERYLILQDQLFNLREQRYSKKIKDEKRIAKIEESKHTGANALASSQRITKKLTHKINRKFDLPTLPNPLHDVFFTPRHEELDEEEAREELYRSTTNIVKPDSLKSSPMIPSSREHASKATSLKSSRPSPRTPAVPLIPEGVEVVATATEENETSEGLVRRQTRPNDDDIQNISPMTGKSKDYTRRIRDQKISYSVARRQLKLAVVELYRELEMLKSYRSLNLTGMRKIVKKFDKVSGHNSLPAYMVKVNQSYLNKTEILDDLVSKTEDMFAVYFENGNHKLAVEKLRANATREEHYMETFITGLNLGLSVPFIIRAAWMGIKSLHEGNPDALFLFQIWGGFFLILITLYLFAIKCLIWTVYKINYPFVFEFNPLHHLDATQIGTVPSVMFFVMSILGWLCFENFWESDFRQIYFPPIFLVFSVVLLFLPLNILHLDARKWLSVGFWRVFFSGFYPVEFRDLIIGDICCSLTYSISNAAFFFCLYATHWSGLLPGNTSGSFCGSSHSRWMGFLSALPGIWRFLQCGRRYLDSGDIFPHLANMCKYTLLIATNAFLSGYRINLDSTTMRSCYILFATLNTVVCTFWDLFMDWSLMQVGSKNFLLRDELAFGSTAPYYCAMVLDPILRCNWIFYIIYASQVQQSAKVSFFVALSEALRRFVWVLFRVENEHCSNVMRFRASRDITLPFTIIKRRQSPLVKGDDGTKREQESLLAPHPDDEEAMIGGGSAAQGEAAAAAASTAPTRHPTFASGVTNGLPSITPQQAFTEALEPSIAPQITFGQRLYRFVEPALRAVGNTLQSAHVRDFERRKDKPKPKSDDAAADSDDDEDEDDFDDDMSSVDAFGMEELIDTDSRRSVGGSNRVPQSPHLGPARRRSRRSTGGSEPPSPRLESQMETPSARDWRARYL